MNRRRKFGLLIGVGLLIISCVLLACLGVPNSSYGSLFGTAGSFAEQPDFICVLNINTATLEQLSALDCCTEHVAQAIIEYREANGSYTYVEQLKNVPGISRSILLKLLPYITV